MADKIPKGFELPPQLPAPLFEQPGVPMQGEIVDQARQPLSEDERRQAIGRIVVNGVGVFTDCMPGAFDPSLLLDVASTATRVASKTPAFLRKIGIVDRVVSSIERFDPTPDVGWVIPAILGLNTAEMVQPSPASSVVRGIQMWRDIRSLRQSAKSTPTGAKLPKNF